MSRLLIRTGIGLAIGAFFIWLSAKDWPMGELFGELRLQDGHLIINGGFVPTNAADEERLLHVAGWSMQLSWLLANLGVLALIHVLRVVRWKPLLDPIAPMSWRDHNRIGAVGFMAMFLLPLRLGELARPYLVKAEVRGVRMTQVLATVVVERVVDGLVVSLLLAAVLTWLPTTDPSALAPLELGALTALAVFLSATLLLVGARWKHDLTVRFVERTAGLVSKRLAHAICDLLDSFLSGLRQQKSGRNFVIFVALTVVYWALTGVAIWTMVRAFYLPVDMVGCFAMTSCVVVGMMIPNAPGNVGSFWYFLLMPVAAYGVASGSTQALAFGFMVWLMQLLQQTAFGAYYIIRGQVSWRRVLEATYQSDATLTADDGGLAASKGS